MNKIIERAIDSINKILEPSSSRFSENDMSKCVDIRNLLEQLLASNMLTNDWILLFCRQLNRLMDYNQLLTSNFWIELHDDIIFVFAGPNGEHHHGNSWERFLERMEFERRLIQRELHFHQIIPEKKSFHRLFCEHEKFLQEYLRRCISLHRKVEVKGLVDNIDDFLGENYGLTEVTFTSETRKRLKEKLKSIDITIDCSTRTLNRLDFSYCTYDSVPYKVTERPSNFLPSLEQLEGNKDAVPREINHLLQNDRWIVILGDPGSSKTTLLRWITCVFAETVLSTHETVNLENDDHLTVRIPILIRIGEFKDWFDQHKTKTLMDYIGEHTWFGEHYCHNDNKNVLKEFLYNGHALILLDGLDEIPEVGHRQEIVDLVRQFIDEYLRAPDFISAFDESIFRCMWIESNFVETTPLSKFGGNQIIITSRIIGYQLYPINGSFMKHYSLLLFNHNKAKEFVNKWMLEVERSILDNLLDEGIRNVQEITENLSKKRQHAIEAMFETSSKLLMSNPSLLSLICTFIFQSPDSFHPKSRIEVYEHAVQAAFHLWKNQEPTISESVLTNFLIDLANYLHLNSPSGLIDAFDMEQLCCLSLKQQNVSKYRVELHKYAKKLISLLESNNGIATERGLQVFGFSHLSFQEYFVAQSLVRSFSNEDITERILSLAINPRFHESLRLALGWISWKWSFDEYEKLCNLFINATKIHKIPFGTLFFLDAYYDLQRLPSNTIIFAALNNLLHHPSSVIARTYLIPNLSQLPEYIIVEWMQLHLKDEKSLFKFCQSFPTEHRIYYNTSTIIISHIIYQQLWLLHNRGSSVEFIVDQTLRTIMISDDIVDQIFNKDFSLYFSYHNIGIFNVHPLILSIIIAVCGGVYLKKEDDMIDIQFSLKQMHRESSIIAPLVKYFDNNEELHSVKIQTLIEYYQKLLEKFLPSDTSVDIVDTFIVLICLQGVSEPFIYQKYDGYKALPLALERLKSTWFYFKELCTSNKFYHEMSIPSEIESIINVFLSQSDQSNKQRISFSVACASALKKLGLWDLPKSFNKDAFENEFAQYFYSQPEFIHLITKEKLNGIPKVIHSEKILRQDPFILLNFLPQSLQLLYWCTTFASNNDTDSLSPVIFLSQCLTHFENINTNDLNSCLTLPMLLPLLKEYMLENYAFVLFQEQYFDTRYGYEDPKELLDAMKDRKLLDSFPLKKLQDWKTQINIERQRIYEAKNEKESQKKDIKLFAASICLARLFEVEYHYRRYRAATRQNLSTTETKEVHFAIMNIFDPILRILAFSTVLDVTNILVVHEEQRNQLRYEMISTLQSLLPDLSLLKLTLLFIRCYTAHKHFPVLFQQMANIIGKKLNETSIDTQSQERQAAYIALSQLNNSDLSPYLSEFIKRTKNISELVQFNSTTFYCYFMNKTSFHESNPILLSTMYVAELAFDAQILNMYVTNNSKNDSPFQTDSKELWNNSWKDAKIMTLEMASGITNTLQTSNKETIVQIIGVICECSAIEKNTLREIEKWLNYRLDKDLNFFAHYAALQLIIEGSKIPDLINVINEMFIIDSEFHLKSLVQCALLSPLIDLTVARQILIILQRNIRHSSKFSIWIDRKEIFELIFELEFERVTSSVQQLPDMPFILMINGCSKDLQIYLAKHLHASINKQIEIRNILEEKYVAIVVHWLINSSIWNETSENTSKELYESIFTLLHDQRFPLIQKAIVNALNSLFSKGSTNRENCFLEDVSITNLEIVICLWSEYPENVVAACLLAYGNYLLKLHRLEIDRNVSDAVNDMLNILFETSSSEIISIRAALCLIIAEDSDVEFSTISTWFSNKQNITLQMKYNIFLQQYLYDINDQLFFIWEMDYEVVDFLEMGLTEFIETLIIDLYNYLCNDDNSYYLSDPTPEYIEIALDVSEIACREFCDAVRKSSFGEKEFKSKLALYCKNNVRYNKALVQLYIAFGTVTLEFVDMLDWLDNIYSLDCLKSLTQVADQDVIEKLFQLLNLTTSRKKFQRFFSVLQSLVQANVISLLEVHQRVSLINHVLYSDFDPSEWRNTNNVISEGLLNLSCFKIELSSSLQKTIFTKCDIDETFQREVDHFDKNYALFSTRNNLLIHFR